MIKTTILFLNILLIFHGLTEAKTVPYKREEDGRIREVYYTQNQVVEVPTSFGFATTVEFGNEIIKTVVSGDTEGWQVVPQGDRLFINPTEKTQTKNKGTNITVITDKRSYYLHIFISPRSDPVFVIKYRYDAFEAPKIISYLETGEQKVVLMSSPSFKLRVPLKGTKVSTKEKKLMLPVVVQKSNSSWYQMTGAETIVVKKVFDDGKFTYFEFDTNEEQPMPTIYIVNDNGYEEQVSTRQDGKFIVVEKLGTRFTLRIGDVYKCIKKDDKTLGQLSEPFNFRANQPVKRKKKLHKHAVIGGNR